MTTVREQTEGNGLFFCVDSGVRNEYNNGITYIIRR